MKDYAQIVNMSRLKILGKNIKKYRLQRNWSQEVLADFVGLSREYISRVEKGQKCISLKKLFLIADTLKVKLNKLIDFE